MRRLLINTEKQPILLVDAEILVDQGAEIERRGPR
jgi:hypothetical protein